MRAIDILKAESNLSQPRKHTLNLPSGAQLEMFCTPITLAERKQAAENARSDEQLEINLQLLVTKATDANGTPLFHQGDLPKLRRLVTAELVAELVNAMYATAPAVADDGEEVDTSPQPSAPNSGKIPS